jgi:predicted RNA binding protein YcfA (HicA-like mRNA interferase family)
MKVRDIIKRIEKDGWAMLPRTGTSHRQYVHPVKTVRVTIARHPSAEVGT